jgi:hypothetical protein
MADVTILAHGTVVQFRLHSNTAREWIDKNVHLEGWQWFGRDSFVIDHRFAHGLIEGIEDAGLKVN